MQDKWYKLDNAAKIFPPNMNKYDTRVFRFSVSLKEKINVEKLEEALNLTLIDYPVFTSVLKKGVFWYYLEESNIKPKISEEHERPCSLIDEGLLFRVTYYKCRINLEVSHALTDGTGTLVFMKSLIAKYLDLTYDSNSYKLIDKSSDTEKSDDSFQKYKRKFEKKSLHNSKKAYMLKGDEYPENNVKVIEGIVSVNEVIKLAKKEKVSLTVYLTSILIESIGKTMSLKERKRPIVITIPVNLRNYYPSYTVRNFFNTVNIDYYYNGEMAEKIVEEVDKKFKKNLSKENIDSKMNSLSKIEDIFILRLIPIFIKDFVLNIAMKITNKYQTITLSNLGIIDMPKTYEQYIEYFSVFINPNKMQVCTCTYLDNLVITFTTKFIDSNIIMNFFRTLSNKGINVSINTNKVGEEYE